MIVVIFSTQMLEAQGNKRSKRKIKKPIIMQFSDVSKCLPEGISLETVVSTKDNGFDKISQTRKIVVVKVSEKLNELGGKCVSNKLVDKTGNEIKFYNLQGCWGNPPADYLEILEAQTKELADLKKKFTVVELTCNPSGGMIQ